VSGVFTLDETERAGLVGDLFFAVTKLCLMGGVSGLLALGAAGTGWRRWIGVMGAAITLLGQSTYLAGALYSTATGGTDGEFELATRAVGALLVGLGMLPLGAAALRARRLPGWQRYAPLLVGLYYAAMIPVQITFFIPYGEPSTTLLAFWGLTRTLLGYAILSEVGRKGSGRR
jgi:hypothetical protein